MRFSAFLKQLRKIAGDEGVLDRPEDLVLYEYDGGLAKELPRAVVFPRSTEHVSAIVKLCNQAEIAVVPRGAGTGLSGGAIAQQGSIIMALTRMTRVLEIDIPNQRAVVQPGVVNLELSNAVSAQGWYFVPDPSSQKACTIGGNVAENSGGPHTLAYGVTVNHVTGLEVVLPDGHVVEFGGKALDRCGLYATGRADFYRCLGRGARFITRRSPCHSRANEASSASSTRTIIDVPSEVFALLS